MADLATDFAGIHSPNPFWLASGPLTNTGKQVMRAFELGWGGAVWKTLGAPVVNVYSRYGGLDYGDQRLLGLNNIELITDRPLEDNLREIKEVKNKFPKNAVIASLMVETREEWRDLIKAVEDAGVDGIELNFGCPHGMCERGMGSAVGQEPRINQEITSWVKEYANVPVIVKLTPNITNILVAGKASLRGGADAVSLINTIKSVIGVDLDRFVPYPYVGGKSTNGGYCGPAVKPIALHMVGSLARDKEFNLPISGIGGISNWRDAAEFILMGAGSVQVCTAAMHYGFRIVREMIDGLSDYMDSKGFKSIKEMIGKAVSNFVEWNSLNMNFRVKADIDPLKCIGCQLCVAACDAGGHQCIHPQNGAKVELAPSSSSLLSRVPKVDIDECIGCNLCSLVCPVPNCIIMKEIDIGKPYQTWAEYKTTLV